MNPGTIKNISAFIIAFLVHLNGMAQCQIKAPKIICIGDLGQFSISIPSGSTLVSADWNFGDGYSGYGQYPGHLYAKTGKFTVKCKLKLTGGNTCEDSVQLDVLKLPTANYTFKTLDTCFKKNTIEILDKSTPANSTQPIIKKLVIWDDGSFDAFSTTAKHSYTQKAIYKVTLEVTDNMGCKHIKSNFVNIVPSLEAKYSHTIDSSCRSTKICFKNTTDTILNNKNKFTWQFDNGRRISSDYKTKQCFTFKSYTEILVKLVVANIYGCNDSFSYVQKVIVDSLPKFQMILADTSVCYANSSAFKLSMQPSGSFDYQWEINNTIFGNNTYKNEIDLRTKVNPIGKKIIKCTVTKGFCKSIIDTIIRVKGPIAAMRIFNKYQCDPSKRVYFIDSSQYTNFNKSSRLWVLTDSLGDSCICHRIQDINKYKNCNYSTDWYHKHDYKYAKLLNKVSLYIYDSITKCSDLAIEYVNTKSCGVSKKDTICQGAMYFSKFQGEKKPLMFSIDSGKTWINVPGVIDKKYTGLLSVLLMYDNEIDKALDYGDDSIKVIKEPVKYTYLYLKDQLFIKENPNPEFKYTLSGNCKYRDAVVKLKDSLMYANETVVISWGDGYNDTIKPKTNYILDSIKHRYTRKEMIGSITVTRTNISGCVIQYHLAIEFGFNIYLADVGNLCARNKVCFNIGVYDIAQGKTWDNTNKLGTIKLLTGESKVFVNDYSPCYQYTSSGIKTVKLIATSYGGCTDSVEIKPIVSDLNVNVTESSKDFGCGEIKQLFDSTTLISPFGYDRITSYLWDFGNKTYSTTQKDPYHSFSKYGKYEVTHVVKSQNGCIDSVKFIVTVVGPQPQFDIITDTIGCQPLTVKFKNNSKNCRHYYWRFGDPAQNTLLNDSITDVAFTYSTPGKYYIKLTGIDEFKSKTTGTTYYCQEMFPEDTAERSVTVLPFLKADFEIPDTVCVGEPIDIKNLSDTRYATLNWDMGDGIKKSVPNTPIVPYYYKKSGTFKVILKPEYSVPAGVPKCSDTAERMITAKGILADFEYERFCESPLFNFKNLSVPENKTTRYNWDFGQPDLPKNETNEKHTQHDYEFNKGNFTVCLKLQDEFGCADSMCQTIVNDFKTKLIIPNVFTPGLTDGKNDEYDIVMDGEEIYELSIFNRWGQIMYQSKTDCQPGEGTNWNGNNENTGFPCPAGTYFYIFNYKSCYGDMEKKRATGTITLIR